jgi:hypothetical protein
MRRRLVVAVVLSSAPLLGCLGLMDRPGEGMASKSCGSRTNCPNHFACDSGICLESCAYDGDCDSGWFCSDDGTKCGQPCGGLPCPGNYACDKDFDECYDMCTSNDECAAGYRCCDWHEDCDVYTCVAN